MTVHELSVITVRGGPAEQGAAFGEEARARISLAIERWCDDVAGHGLEPAVWAGELTGRSGYLENLERHGGRFLRFLDGVAEGSGQPRMLLLAFNMMDEDWEWRRSRRSGEDQPAGAERCTTLAGPTSEGMLAAQNMDIQSWTEGLQTLLKIESGGPSGDIYFACAGPAPTCGINSAGIGMLLNTVSQLTPDPVGLPVCATQFELLHQASLADCSSLLLRGPHSTGQTYTLLDGREILCYECAADGAWSLAPQTASGLLLHTNHPLSGVRRRTDRAERELMSETPSTYRRLEQLKTLLGPAPDLSPEEVKAVLADREDPVWPISREGHADADAIGYTCFSVIYEYGPADALRLHIAPGPPSKTPYRTLRIR